MKPTDKLVFTGITRDRIDAIRTQAKAVGLDLSGSKGSHNWDNCGIEFEYDEKAEKLEIQPSVPFDVPASQIEGEINAIVRSTDNEFVAKEKLKGDFTPKPNLSPEVQEAHDEAILEDKTEHEPAKFESDTFKSEHEPVEHSLL